MKKGLRMKLVTAPSAILTCNLIIAYDLFEFFCSFPDCPGKKDRFSAQGTGHHSGSIVLKNKGKREGVLSR